mgnify:CR=1 FL=1
MTLIKDETHGWSKGYNRPAAEWRIWIQERPTQFTFRVFGPDFAEWTIEKLIKE